MLKGWECPKCSRVFAPHVEECKYCNNISHELITNLPVINPKIQNKQPSPYNTYDIKEHMNNLPRYNPNIVYLWN